MESFKEWILQEMTSLHLSINYGTRYKNNEQGTYDKLKDVIRYEQLKEVVRNNPDLDNTEMGREVSKRVREKTTLSW